MSIQAVWFIKQDSIERFLTKYHDEIKSLMLISYTERKTGLDCVSCQVSEHCPFILLLKIVLICFSADVCSVLAASWPYIVGGLFKVKTFPLQSEYSKRVMLEAKRINSQIYSHVNNS